MKHATSRQLFSYWDSLRAERAAPDRGALEPGSIRDILADTFIIDASDPLDPRFRVAGTRCSALFGRDLTGRPFSDVWAAAGADQALHLVDIVANDASGLVAGLAADTQDGCSVRLELLLLPLRHRGRTRSRLIGSLSTLPGSGASRLDPIVAAVTTSLRVIATDRADVPPDRKLAEAAAARRRTFRLIQGGLATSPLLA